VERFRPAVRIALTHNLRVTGGEAEAEFDRPETIEAIATALRAQGHEVEPVEVAGPAARTVAKLEALAPDLVFNVAEGRRGPYREAFFPALFDELGLAYTASDAYACSIALDKAVTKHLTAALGVPTPRWRMVRRGDGLDASMLEFPVIVKPNFEGSSKGITPESVVDDPGALPSRVAALLERFPAGVLVEEFVAGRDVCVALLASEGALTVLPPVELVHGGGDPRAVLDLATKLAGVETRVPARIEAWTDGRLRELAATVGRALGFRDFAVLDFRVDAAGNPHFIEANALPALDPSGSPRDCRARCGALLRTAPPTCRRRRGFAPRPRTSCGGEGSKAVAARGPRVQREAGEACHRRRLRRGGGVRLAGHHRRHP
jgi:D-alanine-D-alanine ligase